MNTREKWFIKNKTNKSLSIGDLPKVPTLTPKGPDSSHDLLRYHSHQEINASVALKLLFDNGWVSLTKKTDGSSKDFKSDEGLKAVSNAEENETSSSTSSSASGGLDEGQVILLAQTFN